MELVKEKISTTILKSSKYTQFTIDDDFNIPESKEDIGKIIAHTGNVYVENLEVLEGKVKVTGSVEFKVLYQVEGDSGGLESYDGEVLFEETVNMDGIYPGDKVSALCSLEDLYITMINSRKIEARGLVGVKLSACQQIYIEGVTGIKDDNTIDSKMGKLSFTNNAVCDKDVIKIKENLEISSSKPNIGSIIWDQISFHGLETKTVDGGIEVKGEMEVFVIYKADEEGIPMQFLNMTKSFQEVMPVDGVSEGMVLDDNIVKGKGTLSISSDEDGEDRIINVEYSLTIDYRVYEDMELEFAEDMFSPIQDVQAEKEEFCYENLLLKNNAKTKVSHREIIKAGHPQILQIENITGRVEIDEIKMFEDKATANGVINVAVLYVSDDDSKPLLQQEITIPFSYEIETGQLSDKDSLRIVPYLEHISAMMVSGNEMEIKAHVSMNISVFRRKCINIITDMKVLPIDMEKKASMPGMVGYVVKDGDTIWSIAKKYYSNLESIRQINNLTTDDVKPGDKLLVIKS